jgi:Ca2+-binding EF-hand superfamily protein
MRCLSTSVLKCGWCAGDGVLTIEELAEGLASCGITTSRKNFRNLLSEVDADGSGQISLKEWTDGAGRKI